MLYKCFVFTGQFVERGPPCLRLIPGGSKSQVQHKKGVTALWCQGCHSGVKVVTLVSRLALQQLYRTEILLPEEKERSLQHIMSSGYHLHQEQTFENVDFSLQGCKLKSTCTFNTQLF